MVTDRLTNAHLYQGLGPAIARALTYASTTDVAAVADGKYPIDGDAMFALVQRYTTKPLAEGRWEAHRRYIDLQVVLTGRERIGHGHLDRFVQEPYDAHRDLTWLSGAGDFITLESGGFMLLWPEDAHMPGLAVGAPEPVTKVVVKIELEGRPLSRPMRPPG